MQRVLGNNDTGKRHQPDNGTGKNGTMKLTSIYEKMAPDNGRNSMSHHLLLFYWHSDGYY
jgi:hypothetical protein